MNFPHIVLILIVDWIILNYQHQLNMAQWLKFWTAAKKLKSSNSTSFDIKTSIKVHKLYYKETSNQTN